MRVWRRLAGGLTAAAAVLALAGCTNAEPGVVAYVGENRITEGQLNRAVDGIGSTLQEGQQVSRDAVVDAMVHGILAEQIATAKNVRVSDAERDELIRTSDLVGLLAVPDAKALAYDVADQQIVAQKVGAEAYLAEVQATSVTLNPRFGVLDPDQKLITSVEQTGSLSRPQALPVESP